MTSEERVIQSRYRLLRKLGSGGFESVWLAEDILLGRAVALKELVQWRDFGDLTQRRARAVREARALASVNHPAIVHIHDVIFVKDDPWIVMDYISGRTLASIIQDSPLEEHALARIGLPVIRGLSAVHSAHVLHRDVKPANIVISSEGAPFLVGFGISEVARDEEIDHDNGIVGTPAFLAPERLLGKPASPASDLWSLGATFFNALEGYSPFSRRDLESVIEAILHEDTPDLTKQGRLAGIVLRLLHKDPPQRPKAAEVAEVLQSIIDESARRTPESRGTYVSLEDSRHVFLAHSSQDKPAVRDLHSRLIAAGHVPWLDEEEILPGQDWDFEIRKALTSVDCVIVCLSKNSVTKIGYIQKEVKRALDIADEYPESEIFVLPVRLEECEVPSRLRKLQYVDIFSPRGFQLILASLQVVQKR
jgi:serine/threonine protein kinase